MVGTCFNYRTKRLECCFVWYVRPNGSVVVRCAHCERYRRGFLDQETLLVDGRVQQVEYGVLHAEESQRNHNNQCKRGSKPAPRRSHDRARGHRQGRATATAGN